jgi:hypothetical protein
VGISELDSASGTATHAMEAKYPRYEKICLFAAREGLKRAHLVVETREVRATMRRMEAPAE